MSAPFSTILVANRGEIAVRIMRTCREMGIRTVAIYSTADADALHVRNADEAYCVGPPPALESYLRIDAILEAARASGAEAVHPGYGFLAENPELARRVIEAGLVWVGPPPEVIALLGDKVAAKEIARDAGVPIVPGYMGDDGSLERMTAEAERIGYPVMLKAAAGGGGKGMRVVEGVADLPAALEGARREARSAFGDDRVFLEKLLVGPRHIEIQVLLDSHGGGVYLGERECSIQRRHQKVVEEAPSPVLTADLRALMGGAALRLARAAGYVNAGTVEFLFAGDTFYFLEVNTRIQVEHPVTEMVTGLDLVRLQLEIAAGQPLSLNQIDVQPRGHAVEARLYAEDPSTGFLPATGTVDLFLPPLGPGVRNDVGIASGSQIGPYYDPILAKLIVHADTRHSAIARLTQALEQYTVLGVTTNLSFLRWIAQQPQFLAGRADTGFVDRAWQPDLQEALPPEALMLAAVFEASSGVNPPSDHASGESPWRQGGGWRVGGGARVYRYSDGRETWTVSVTRGRDGSLVVHLAEVERVLEVSIAAAGSVVIHDGPRVVSGHCVRTANGLTVAWAGQTYELTRPELDQGRSTSGGGGGRDEATAPMPGTVVKVVVQPGQTVAAREPLVVIEAMKMEHVVEAPHAGVVSEVLYREGDMVTAGAPVVRLEAS